MVSLEVIETPVSKPELDPEKWRTLLIDLGHRIREEGHLIVFPTETVYGLGANALQRDAVLRIFEAKRRPLQDPVICHVSCYENALPLFDCHPIELTAARLLGQRFWPGPLSIVAKASSLIPPEVTAGTGFVAVRVPNNPVALDLIRAARVPIAAPSANRFGHISPSCANHVTKNFPQLTLSNFPSQKNLVVLDGGSCSVGIESTVCRVELVQRLKDSDDASDPLSSSPSSPTLKVTVLRRGGCVTNAMLYGAIVEGAAELRKQSLTVKDCPTACTEDMLEILQRVEVINMAHPMMPYSVQQQEQEQQEQEVESHRVSLLSGPCRPAVDFAVNGGGRETSLPAAASHGGEGRRCRHPVDYLQTVSPMVPMVSPGMLLSHYAPSVPTYLCHSPPPTVTQATSIRLTDRHVLLQHCVLIDSFNQLQRCQPFCRGYFSLTRLTDGISVSDAISDGVEVVGKDGIPTQSERVVQWMASRVFHRLHAAEDCAIEFNADAILIYDFWSMALSMGEPGLGVYDRLYRSASGRWGCFTS